MLLRNGAKCPKSLLEAQTIVARSWILAAKEKKHQNLGLDACNDDCCQRYQGISNVIHSSVKAAQNTRKVLIRKKQFVTLGILKAAAAYLKEVIMYGISINHTLIQ